MDPREDIEEKQKFRQESFIGGMRRDLDPTQYQDNEYALLINGRNRDGNIVPVESITDHTAAIPAGKKQGLYGADSVLIVFCDGLAYAKDYADNNPNFALIPNLLLDEDVDYIYGEFVPASWQNYQRKSVDGDDVTQGVALFTDITGTPAGFIAQDGINRPWLILSVGQCRRLNDFNDWSNTEYTDQDTREYVPIGKQMMYHASSGILFIVSPDGKELYRSVTGRPLDFVVAIDTNGNKLPPLASGKPEASRLSYNLDYNPITALRSIPAPPRTDTEDNGFYVGTLKKSWIVYPDYSSTLFGEPTFSNQDLFTTGPLNHTSITELLGDIAIITESGITTFNSVENLAVEGSNAPFFRSIEKLFNGVTQTTTCSYTSDNYAFLGINTIYGPALLVYDTLTERFAALDIYSEVTGYFKQFAEIKVSGVRRLFAITTDDKVVELFSGETELVKFYTREWVSDDNEQQLIPRRVRITLNNVMEDGELTLTPYVDGRAGPTQTKTITANRATNLPPLAPPFGTDTAKSTLNRTFIFDRPFKGEKVGLYITFNFKAELQRIQFICEEDATQVSDDEQGVIFNSAKTL